MFVDTKWNTERKLIEMIKLKNENIYTFGNTATFHAHIKFTRNQLGANKK